MPCTTVCPACGNRSLSYDPRRNVARCYIGTCEFAERVKDWDDYRETFEKERKEKNKLFGLIQLVAALSWFKVKGKKEKSHRGGVKRAAIHS